MPKSSRKPDEATVVDDDFIPGIPDTLENVARTLVKTPSKRPDEWKFMKGKKNPPKVEID
jgi:hypothetical protein